MTSVVFCFGAYYPFDANLSNGLVEDLQCVLSVLCIYAVVSFPIFFPCTVTKIALPFAHHG